MRLRRGFARQMGVLMGCWVGVCLLAPNGGRAMAEAASEKVVLPDELCVAAIQDPKGAPRFWEEIEGKWKAGDPEITRWVERSLERADQWAARPDEYYVGLFRPESPFGRCTISCPFHPEVTGWCPFDWDPDHPWRLTCPLCAKEGREPAYYPNALYPDEGQGCRPTDEAWRSTHDAAWGEKYGFPWERWDGHTHGNVDGFAYHFLGYSQWRIFFELTWRRQILSTLCKGYVFASRLHEEGSPAHEQAAVYAHKAKLIMVWMTRAIMGDSYLQAALGIEPDKYRAAVESLARDADGKPLAYREFPGYEERDTISDHSDSDPDHPLGKLAVGWWNKATTVFLDCSWAMWAAEWLPAYAMIQSGFTEAEREAGLDALVERLLVSEAGDAERVGAGDLEVRQGIVDKGLHPYEFRMRGNLSGGEAVGNLRLGLMLRDPRIIRNVASAIHEYLRGGYFTTDGLGYETSPHYTQVALNNLAPALAVLHGMKEGFGPGDVFWDAKSGALNPYLDPALASAAFSPLLSVLPDGHCATWTDSWVTERPNLAVAELVANATGAIPERFAPWLDVSTDGDGRLHLKLKDAPTLPSYVLPENGMAVMRAGVGRDQTFVSVDWSKATGHSHDGPLNLLVYAAGHEMLVDQGYLNNVTPTQAWMNSAESHNTALIRTKGGSTRHCVTWRGGMRFFADTPMVKAVEVAEEDEDLLRGGMEDDERAMFQRTVILVETAAQDERPPPTYIVDIFRLQGGTTHEYYIHSLGDTLSVEGAQLQPAADAALSLYDVSGFSYRTSSGAKAITGISRAATDDALTATWRDMKDWRSVPPVVDRDAALDVHLLGAPGTEVLVGTATGQRYIDARDVAQRVTVLCARRSADAYRETPNAFAAVIEAHRGPAGAVERVDRLALVSGDRAAVGLRITRPGGVDYILSTTQDDTATCFGDPAGGRELTVTGRLAVVRIEAGEAPSRLLLQADELTVED